MKPSQFLADLAIKCGVIRLEDRDTYMVATSLLLFSSLTWGTLLILGFLFKQTAGSFVFLIFHLPLRIFAGGFHQDTRGKCYLQSCIIFLILFCGAASPYRTWIATNGLILIILSFCIIWRLAPVEAINKPLKPEEFQKYRFTARSILVAETLIAAFLSVGGYHNILYYACISLILATVQLITGVFCERPHRIKRNLSPH